MPGKKRKEMSNSNSFEALIPNAKFNEEQTELYEALKKSFNKRRRYSGSCKARWTKLNDLARKGFSDVETVERLISSAYWLEGASYYIKNHEGIQHLSLKEKLRLVENWAYDNSEATTNALLWKGRSDDKIEELERRFYRVLPKLGHR